MAIAQRTLRATILVAVLLAATFTGRTTSMAAGGVTPNNIGGTSSSTGSPSFALQNTVAVGDYLLVLCIQAAGAEPGAPTDTLNTPFLRLGGNVSPNGQLGYSLWGTKATAAGRDTITCNTTAATAAGARGYANVALNKHGGPEGTSGGWSQPKSIFNADGQTASVGDLIVSIVVALGNETFTVDPQTIGTWADIASRTGSVSFDLQETSPNPAGYADLVWNASSPITAMTASVTLAHN